MKALTAISVLLLVGLAAQAQQNKWMKDEKNVLTVTITHDATKAELLDLQAKLWKGYEIKFDCPEMKFTSNGKKLKFLSLKVEMPTGELGTVSTSFLKPSQVIGFHFDRNNDAYDVFGVWTR